MNESLPSVTIIIPTRPDGPQPQAVTAARALDYPKEKLEILVARGRQPSVQRNTAIRAAKGELIYFLDDDSLAQPGNLRRAVEHFRNPQVAIVGGPNLCPPDAPWLEQVFALVLESWLAFGPSRARYKSVGKLRETGEKELILCNQLARRETLLKHGGFNEALYPNEENALMDDIRKSGGKLLYDPNLVVYRRPRGTLKAFAKMLMTYGRGRAEQFRVNPTFGSILNFVPPIFCVYLLLLLVVWGISLNPPQRLPALIFTMPLVAYVAVVLVQTIVLLPSAGLLRSICAMPLLVLSHLMYGIGFWRGLFTRLKLPDEKPATTVQIETVQP